MQGTGVQRQDVEVYWYGNLKTTDLFVQQAKLALLSMMACQGKSKLDALIHPARIVVSAQFISPVH